MSDHDTPSVYRVLANIAVVIESESAVVVLRPLADPDLSIEAVLTAQEAHDLARVLDGTAGHVTASPAQRRAASQ